MSLSTMAFTSFLPHEVFCFRVTLFSILPPKQKLVVTVANSVVRDNTSSEIPYSTGVG